MHNGSGDFAVQKQLNSKNTERDSFHIKSHQFLNKVKRSTKVHFNINVKAIWLITGLEL